MRIPYFLSAQPDGTQERVGNPKNTSRLEGWIEPIVFNVFVWMAAVALDIHLLAFEFNDPGTQVHVLQIAALASVSAAAFTIVFFTLMHYAPEEPPPTFATALISGGFKATLGFSYLLLLLNNAPDLNHDSPALKILVAQVCLKHFGSAMALANARLHVYPTATRSCPSTSRRSYPGTATSTRACV